MNARGVKSILWWGKGLEHPQDTKHRILYKPAALFLDIYVFLFKESDNLLAINESKAFWTSDMWNFDDGYFCSVFFGVMISLNFLINK